MAVTYQQLRTRLSEVFRRDADFDAFVGDRFPSVGRRFSDGMNRVRKTTILFEQVELAQLEEELNQLRPLSSSDTASPPASGRIKILFLAANPRTKRQNELSREARHIKERLGVGRARDVFTFKAEWAARRSDLQRLLLEERPQVLHFSGHGSPGAQLYLEDENGDHAPVEAKALASLIGALRYRPQLVVLNVCSSEPFASALTRHVPFAVGMRCLITDNAACVFAASFYEAVALDEPIANAFQIAKSALLTQQLPGDNVPILKKKRGVDPLTRLTTNP